MTRWRWLVFGWVMIAAWGAQAAPRAWPVTVASCPLTAFAAPVLQPLPGCHAPAEAREMAACAAGPQGWQLCKCLSADSVHDARFVLQQQGRRVRQWQGEAFFGSIDDFQAAWLDADGDGQPQLLLANRTGETMGMGVRYWQLSVWPDSKASGQPGVLAVQEYGPDAWGVLPGKQGCQLLATTWRTVGSYTQFAGLWTEYRQGRWQAVPGYAAYGRRYLHSFEQERLDDINGHSPESAYFGKPRTWLSDPRTQRVPARPVWRELQQQ